MLHHGLLERARSQPESLALEHDSIRYTLAWLNDTANGLAVELIDRIDGQGCLVAILSSNPVLQLVTAFAVWKAGSTVLILDPGDPESRLKQILDDAGVGLLVTGPECHGLASSLSTRPMVFDPSTSYPSDNNLDRANNPDQAAAIIYTSGSTGQPKGVLRTHRNILIKARQRSCFALGAGDRVSMMFPLNFGYGLNFSITALLNGASLFAFSPTTQGIAPFADWLCGKRITVLAPPISYLRSFLNTLRSGIGAHACRCMILGGENLYATDVENIHRAFGANCELIRTYGLTETALVTCYRFDQTRPVPDPIPLGYPVDDVEVRIVDEHGREQAIGENGEIAVVSSNLPPGYRNDATLTEEKYRPLPDGGSKRMFLTGDVGSIRKDGLVFLFGRRDEQLKVQGYRVDLGEVENALNRIEGVANAAVVAIDTGAGEKRIAAFVDRCNESLSIQDLRHMAAAELPRYMVPDRIVLVDAIPLTSRGKVDRRLLAGMAAELSKSASASRP